MTEHANTPPAGVELDPALQEHAPILANSLELYAHDFSEFRHLDIGADGRFRYKPLPLYWSQPNRHPFLIRAEGKLAGLALVKGSQISGIRQSGICRNFILGGCRRRGIGTLAAQEAWEAVSGLLGNPCYAIQFLRESILESGNLTLYWRDYPAC